MPILDVFFYFLDFLKASIHFDLVVFGDVFAELLEFVFELGRLFDIGFFQRSQLLLAIVLLLVQRGLLFELFHERTHFFFGIGKFFDESRPGYVNFSDGRGCHVLCVGWPGLKLCLLPSISTGVALELIPGFLLLSLAHPLNQNILGLFKVVHGRELSSWLACCVPLESIVIVLRHLEGLRRQVEKVITARTLPPPTRQLIRQIVYLPKGT